MTTSQPVTFGIKTSQANTTYDRVLATWREADEIDAFADAWLWDHLVPLRGDVRGPALEAWTLLAALAAQTRRLRLGVIVTSNRTRSPALLAKMAATVDHISGGRLVFGIGAGGSRVADPAGLALVKRELGAYGFDVVPTGEAIGALAEACTIVRRMWTESEPFDFDGRWYRLHGAVCEPKPIQRPGPPVMIGAGGRRSLRVVAEQADIWNCPTLRRAIERGELPGRSGDVEEFRRLSGVLDEHCAEIGRDPATITRSVQLLVQPTPATSTTGIRSTPQPELPRFSDPAATRDLILAFVEAGVNHVVLAPVASDIDRPATWLAEEVVEPVRRILAAEAAVA
jgi:alkanesulfonate monooxygenase SsuD/methylene tetrahydromethanopterin reductase-like flavin-dependent oxidoreductase (luciferase family)